MSFLAACTTDHTVTGGHRDPAASQAQRPPYQRTIAPLYPSDDTPRLIPLGDFDTPRDYLGRSWRHSGIDIGGRRGAAVIAAAPGEACVAREEIGGLVVHLVPRRDKAAGGGSDLVFVTNPEAGADAGRHPVRIAYAHLQGVPADLKQCRFVEMGTVLGWIGTSGIASLPHLHFEVVAQDPAGLPGDPRLQGAINPFYLMRRDTDDPPGTITCFREGMVYRPNPGDPPDALNLVWPTQRC